MNKPIKTIHATLIIIGVLVTTSLFLAAGNTVNNLADISSSDQLAAVTSATKAGTVTDTQILPSYEPTYTLTVSKDSTGSGTGTIISNIGNINCVPACTSTSTPIAQNATVFLRTTAASGSKFVGWSGACTNSGAICAVSMNENKNVKAKFDLIGNSDNQPPSTPAHVSISLTSLTSVRLTWTPSTDNVGVVGYKVSRCIAITGICNGRLTQIGTSYTTTYEDAGLAPSSEYMYVVSAYDAAGNVGAPTSPIGEVFPDSTYRGITLTKLGTGGGDVYDNYWGIECGTICFWPYPRGTVLTLRSTADSNSTFTGWGGDVDDRCSNLPIMDCVLFPLWENINVTATFTNGFPPIITSYTGAVPTDVGGYSKLSVQASGAPLTFQWQKATWDGTGHLGDFLNVPNPGGVRSTLSGNTGTSDYFTEVHLAPTNGAYVAYRVIASNNYGSATSPRMAVDVHSQVPSGISFTANPAVINVGQSTTLSWSSQVSNTTCIGGGDFPAGTSFNTGNLSTGTAIVSPTQNSLYRINCGNKAAYVWVYVNGAPRPGVTPPTQPSSPKKSSQTATLLDAFNNLLSNPFGSNSDQNLSAAVKGSDAITNMQVIPSGSTTYTLDISKTATGSGTGTVTSNVGNINCGPSCSSISAPFAENAIVFLKATPASGSTFVGWSGACTNAGAICAVTMNQAKSVTAKFSNVNPSDIVPPTTPPRVSVKFASLTSLNIVWTPSTDNVGVVGYKIGRCLGSSISCTSYVQIATTTTNAYLDAGLLPSSTYMYTVSAYDAAGNTSAPSSPGGAVIPGSDYRGITVTKSGNGTGDVYDRYWGIECGSVCFWAYPVGTPLPLRALASPDSIFRGWSGDPVMCASSNSNSDCAITLDTSKNLIATFSLKPTVTPPTLPIITTQPQSQTVALGVNANFSVIASNGGLSLSYQWQKGTGGGNFSNIPWANYATLVTHAITAADNGSTYRVIVSNAAGTVTSNVVTLTVAPSRPGATSPSSPARVSQTASLLDAFNNLLGIAFGSNSDQNLAAAIKSGSAITDPQILPSDPTTYTLTVSKDPTGSGTGTITSNVGNINCGPSCTSTGASFNQDAIVFIKAVSSTGSIFVGWSGACTNTGALCSVTMNEAKNVTAKFNPVVTDTTAPNISNVSYVPLSQNSVKMTWTTDEPSNSQVDYGFYIDQLGNIIYGNSTPVDPALVTSHSVTMTGLNSNTGSSYRVRSRDASGNLKISGDYHFVTPQNVLPITTSVSTNQLSPTSQKINWTTDIPSDTQVEYGTTALYNGKTQVLNFRIINGSSYYVTNHSITIDGLLPNTVYHFRTRSSTSFSNSRIPAASSDYTFTTLASPSMDTQAPSVPTNIGANGGSGWMTVGGSASSDNVGVAGYKIYENGVQIGVASMNNLHLNLVNGDNVAGSNCHIYTISAFDAAGNNSDQSAQAIGCTNGQGYSDGRGIFITKTGTGIGRVYQNDYNLDCGENCSPSYRLQTGMTLRAMPWPGTNSTFTGWGGDAASCGTNPQCNINLNSHKFITANFQFNQ